MGAGYGVMVKLRGGERWLTAKEYFSCPCRWCGELMFTRFPDWSSVRRPALLGTKAKVWLVRPTTATHVNWFSPQATSMASIARYVYQISILSSLSRPAVLVFQATSDSTRRALHNRQRGFSARMAFSTRSLGSHIRQPSTSGNSNAASSGGQSAALQARVNEKKGELENLKELRDLSAAVATQMEALEQKLSTLSDGTEGALPRIVPRGVLLTTDQQHRGGQPLPQL